MLVKPGEHGHLAELLQFIVLGEQLAHDCAKVQATLVREPGMQRFLIGQAKQEGCHALVFQWAIRWLAPRGPHSLLISHQMNQYRRLLTSALTRGDVAESLLAEQIILEGLGQAILQRLETGLMKRDASFRKLRRILLQQEEAHHGFGLRTLNKKLNDGQTSIDHLRALAPEYLDLEKRCCVRHRNPSTSSGRILGNIGRTFNAVFPCGYENLLRITPSHRMVFMRQNKPPSQERPMIWVIIPPTTRRRPYRRPSTPCIPNQHPTGSSWLMGEVPTALLKSFISIPNFRV